jgi:release factor glutamine methyltransferase
VSDARTWTVLELLQWTEEHFESHGIDTARLDAEVLLAHALGTKRLQLYVDFEKPIYEAERSTFRELVVRRARDRVPVSLLLGSREFWSLELTVTEDVLSPRPETETLVEAGLASLPDPAGDYAIVDLGTGSGAIALALASERPGARVTATDISPQALQIARTNADKLHLSERIRFVEGDLLAAVPGEQFDLVVSNPPYVARRDAGTLPPELAHEPEVALFGGEDGFEVSSRLVGEVMEALVPGGTFAVELAPDQTERIAEECRKAGLVEVETLRDLARRPRVVVAHKPSERVTET